MIDRNSQIRLDKWKTETLPETEGLRCVKVYVPNTNEAVSVLAGLIAQATNYWNFIGSDADRKNRANKFLEGYVATDWGGCVDCDEVKDCIENDAGVQSAIISASQGGGNPAGVPLSPANRANDLTAGLNPECDPDVLWSLCLGLVKWTDRLITDFFDEFETFANPVELAAAFAKLPVLDEIGADAVADYVNMTIESVQENYAADYNEDYEIALACELFCMAQADCVVNIDMVFGVLKGRVETQVGSIFTWNGLIDMLNDIVAQDIDVVNVADLIFCMAWGSVALANFLLNIQIGFQAIQRAIAVFDEGSNDWETLCEECPVEMSYLWDFGAGATFSDVYINVGAWDYVGGVGMYTNQPAQNFIFGYGYLEEDRIAEGVAWTRITYTFEKTAGGNGGATDDIFINSSPEYQEYNPAGEYEIVIDGAWVKDATNPVYVGIGYFQSGGGALTIKSVKLSWLGGEQVGLAGGTYV